MKDRLMKVSGESVTAYQHSGTNGQFLHLLALDANGTTRCLDIEKSIGEYYQRMRTVTLKLPAGLKFVEYKSSGIGSTLPSLIQKPIGWGNERLPQASHIRLRLHAEPQDHLA